MRSYRCGLHRLNPNTRTFLFDKFMNDIESILLGYVVQRGLSIDIFIVQTESLLEEII